jgi:hypothetical protein
MAGTPRGMEIAGNEDEAPAQQVWTWPVKKRTS